MRLASIVEGDAEVEALPVLLRNLTTELRVRGPVEVMRPVRRPRTKLVRGDELERAIALVAKMTSRTDAILILIDADDDCPAHLGPMLLARAKAAQGDRRISVVLAKREFEAWFLATAESLAGTRGLRSNISAPQAPELIRDAKGWLTKQRVDGRSYRPTVDQAALAHTMDLNRARSRSPSFAKLCRDLKALLGETDSP